MRTLHLSLACLLTLFSVATARPSTLADSPAEPRWPADLETGPHTVLLIEEINIQRDGRDSPMPLRIRYPQPTDDNPGPFPVVIFSHGMGGFIDAFEHLSTHLASHGYVVLHPAHTDSIQVRRRAGESVESLRRTFTRGATATVDLASRVADCLWILDHHEDIETQIERPNLLDTNRAAMAGHSAGAMTTQALAGLRFAPDRARRSMSYSDGSRFLAYVIISGQGTTRPSLNERSWDAFNRPTLVLSGTEDVSRVSDETPESRRHPYEYAPAGDKYLIHIEGATHSSYQGARAPNADARCIEALTTHATRSFLDLHIRQAELARTWLNDPNPDKFKGIRAQYHTK